MELILVKNMVLQAQFGSTPPALEQPVEAPVLLPPTVKERHVLRPPVQHKFSIPSASELVKRPYVFQHELLQNFSISLFCKVMPLCFKFTLKDRKMGRSIDGRKPLCNSVGTAAWFHSSALLWSSRVKLVY